LGISIYDEAYGDDVNNISAGTKFADTDRYICLLRCAEAGFYTLEDSSV
jgi:rubredoxin